MLEVQGLVVRQGDFALRADFALEARARVAVIGPSGGGKSTLIGALTGFVPAGTGQILRDGVEITTAAPDQRGMATLFQDGNLFPHLTLAQNVGLGLRPSLRLNAEERSRVETSLGRVGLADLGGRRPAEVSGGQQSRAALARVLVMARPWLVLDEPFAALGPALRAEMLDLLSEILEEAQAGLVIVTHAPEDARRIADQTIVVADGDVHAPVDTAALFANPPEVLRAYLGTPAP